MKIKEVVPIYNGLFSHILDPVYGQEIDPQALDINFIASYGERTASPLLRAFVIDGKLTETSLSQLANYLHKKYEVNWRRYGVIKNATYDPQITINTKETEKTEIEGQTLNNLLSKIAGVNNRELKEKLAQDFTKSGEIDVTGENNNTTDSTLTSTVRGSGKTSNDSTSHATESTNNTQTRTPNLTTTEITTPGVVTSEWVEGSLTTTNEIDLVNIRTPLADKSTTVTESGKEHNVEGRPTETISETKQTAGFGSSNYVPDSHTVTTHDSISITNDKTYENRTTRTTETGESYKDTQQGKTNTETVQDNRKKFNGYDHGTNETVTSTTGTEETTTKGTKTTETSTNDTGTTEHTDTTNNKAIDTVNGTNNEVTTYKDYKEHTGNDNETVESSENSTHRKDSGDETHNETIKRTKEMEGDLGVTATSQLLQKEYDFWSNWNYVNAILKDVGHELGLEIRRVEYV